MRHLEAVSDSHIDHGYNDAENKLFAGLVIQISDEETQEEKKYLIDDVERFYNFSKQPSIRKEAKQVLGIHSPERLLPAKRESRDKNPDFDVSVADELEAKLAAICGPRGAWCSERDGNGVVAIVASGSRPVIEKLLEKVPPKHPTVVRFSWRGRVSTSCVSSDKNSLADIAATARELGLLELDNRPLTAA